MKIALLTSSRADYGIYRPLIQKLKADPFFDLKIIAFGTHLSHFHGYTLQEIERDGYEVFEKIESLLLGDSPESISTAMGLTQVKFANLWANLKGNIDLMICLGDRYEMLTAVLASVPFQIPVAHIHGGETTLGAMDNVFRHSLSLMAQYHFVSTEPYAQKVAEVIGTNEHIYNVGALSLDNLHLLELLSVENFEKKYHINLLKPSILFTFHPETVGFEKNKAYILEIMDSLEVLLQTYQVIITMPNADTAGNMIRENLLNFAQKHANVFIVESFGTLGYFSCLKYCSFVLGNSSSGIIEAASFGKYVLNLGDRQKGRAAGENVIHLPILKEKILETAQKISNLPVLSTQNIYGQGNTAAKMIEILKKL